MRTSYRHGIVSQRLLPFHLPTCHSLPLGRPHILLASMGSSDWQIHHEMLQAILQSVSNGIRLFRLASTLNDFPLRPSLEKSMRPCFDRGALLWQGGQVMNLEEQDSLVASTKSIATDSPSPTYHDLSCQVAARSNGGDNRCQRRISRTWCSPLPGTL